MECRIHWIQPIINSTLLIADSTASVLRGCTNTTIDSDNCGVFKYTLQTEHYCFCKGDLCNACPTMKASHKIKLAVLILSLYVVILVLQWKGRWYIMTDLLDDILVYGNLPAIIFLIDWQFLKSCVICQHLRYAGI